MLTTSTFPNCWDVKNCGRQKGGAKVAELGECIASKEGMGHSCWAIAGTLCGGIVQGTVAQKQTTCMNCGVYKDYNRVSGARRKELASTFPNETKKYSQLMLAQLKATARAAS